ncbi:uncharacterized protein [Onthophagus taurus]|uniref:uncharacterized protein n=1 Tax=Onthophagus taurus TaxID=166361 RepID=UPI0039BE62DD
MWSQKRQDKYTFVAEERNGKSIIDYITYTRNLQTRVEEVKTEAEAEMGTNHRLVMATINNIEIEREKMKTYTKIHIHKLRQEEERLKYQEKQNKQRRWRIFKEIMRNKAMEVCGMRKYNNQIKRTHWWNEEVRQSIKKKKESWKKYIRTNWEVDRANYRTNRDVDKNMVREAKKKSWKEFGTSLSETYGSNNRKFWNQIRKLKGDQRK